MSYCETWDALTQISFKIKESSKVLTKKQQLKNMTLLPHDILSIALLLSFSLDSFGSTTLSETLNGKLMYHVIHDSARCRYFRLGAQNWLIRVLSNIGLWISSPGKGLLGIILPKGYPKPCLRHQFNLQNPLTTYSFFKKYPYSRSWAKTGHAAIHQGLQLNLDSFQRIIRSEIEGFESSRF